MALLFTLLVPLLELLAAPPVTSQPQRFRPLPVARARPQQEQEA